MADTNTAQAPDAAQDETPAVDAGQVPQETNESTGNVDSILNGIEDPEMLEEALRQAETPRPKQEAQPEADEANDDEADPEQSETAAEDDGTESGDEDDQPTTVEEPQKGSAKNFRLHTDDPKRAAYFKLLKANPDADPIDLAIKAGFSAKAAVKEAEAVEETQEATEQEADPLQGLRDEIAELEKSQEAFEEGYNFAESLKVGRTIAKKHAELVEAKMALKEQEKAAKAFESGYTDARAKAGNLHPETTKPGTRQFKLLRMLVSQKEAEEPGFFANPGYPLQLIAELEKDFPEAFPKKGKAPVAAQAKAAPQTKGQPQTARPMGSTVPAAAGKPVPKGAELMEAIANMSEDELRALADKVGTHPTGPGFGRR